MNLKYHLNPKQSETKCIWNIYQIWFILNPIDCIWDSGWIRMIFFPNPNNSKSNRNYPNLKCNIHLFFIYPLLNESNHDVGPFFKKIIKIFNLYATPFSLLLFFVFDYCSAFSSEINFIVPSVIVFTFSFLKADKTNWSSIDTWWCPIFFLFSYFFFLTYWGTQLK